MRFQMIPSNHYGIYSTILICTTDAEYVWSAQCEEDVDEHMGREKEGKVPRQPTLAVTTIMLMMEF